MKQTPAFLQPDGYLFAALGALAINLVSQMLAFPIQVILMLYGVLRKDVRYMPGLYITLLDASYFPFKGLESVLKFRLIIPLSVLNIFCIVVFLVVVCELGRKRFDRSTLMFVPFWVILAIPALVIALRGKADGVASNWQTPLIYLLIPAFYYWGILAGYTWREGRLYFMKRFLIIYIVQVGLEVFQIYRPGCEFQNHAIPIAFGAALFMLEKSSAWHGLGLLGVIVGWCGMLFERYAQNIEMYQVTGETAVVSTFSRLGVVLVCFFLVVTVGKTLRGGLLRAFPWMMLVLCSAVFFYAVVRADTNVQSEVVSGSLSGSESSSFLARFEMKLVADRGVVWSDALHNELFEPPLIFKRLRDKELYHPILGRMVTKMAPHNQFLTLVCRSGWWLGFWLVLFLWWMHVREFNQAVVIQNDRPTLIALLAPSAAIFIAVGLSGQHVFTQMWHASSMASLTFPGILYGAVLSMRSMKVLSPINIR